MLPRMAFELKTAGDLLRRQRLAGLCIALIILQVSVQAVHVHGATGSADTTCLVCVSARTSAPTAVAITQVVLIALASVAIVRELSAPTFSASLPLFIRPPPSA